MTERLQKYLARSGIGSRREIEGWIRQGRVFIDGEMATVGIKVDHKSRITVDGKYIIHKDSLPTEDRLILYHKPRGEMCTRNDPKGRPTIFENLPVLSEGRWVTVGRLDINTTGALLLTTNGDLAHKLMHPSFGFEREYLCRIRGDVSSQKLEKLLTGVWLEGKRCRFESADAQSTASSNHHWYKVIVREGHYREVRRLWSSVNCMVSRLIRIRYGPIQLPRDLKPGQYKEILAPRLQELLLLIDS